MGWISSWNNVCISSTVTSSLIDNVENVIVQKQC
jgi:hypothetical protein